jgi:DNA replication protein DnaC
VLGEVAGVKRARRIERRFDASGLKVKKTLEAFDFPFQPRLDRAVIENLATLRFLDTHEDVLFTGKSGTGKSHILQSLVLKACEQERLVRYARCVDLVDALYAGLADGSYERRMRWWCRPDLLVIDDVGLGQLKRRDDEPTAAHLLFTLLDRRHMVASTAITSNVKLSAWGKYLGDTTLTAAILDRLAANSIHIDIDGPSYRQHLALRRAREQGLEPPTAAEQA